MVKNEKIAFCITCMNRLNHLQHTLEKNIQDNYLIGEVEFILLDYNSRDGLQEWVQNSMKKYIDEGILIFYKTIEPMHYMRSHSRNMAFRLANATLLCNLDADNFLGNGFAQFIIKEFSKSDDIFITNNCLIRDTFGRICVRNEDFISIRGYNEALQGYGDEDSDIQNRLIKKGLKPVCLNNPEFYHFISHSFNERISEEPMFKILKTMYISYINPYTSEILLLNKNYTINGYTLVDNWQLNMLSQSLSVYNNLFDDRSRVILQNNVIEGTWSEDSDQFQIQKNGATKIVQKKALSFTFVNSVFYEVQDDEVKATIIALLTTAINFNKVIKQINSKSLINPDSYGKGIVYKNFDFSNKIILS